MSRATGPDLCLYNLTLQKPSSAVQCCIGNFTGEKKQQQIVRATSSSIEVWSFDKKTGALRKLVDQNAYSNIRTINNVRLNGSQKDLLIVTSDSGNLCVLEYNESQHRLQRVIDEPYFKSGLRTITPGEYIAVDGRNRAFMLGAIEKNKFSYTIGTDNGHATVSSPLEANRPGTTTSAICGLDVGFDNPIFAAIEMETGKGVFKDQPLKKVLTYYELDLGLNHTVIKYSEEVPDTTNYILSVPGGISGPSGVLVCSQGLVQYRYLSKMIHSVPIPQRDGPRLIVSGVVHVMKKSFFILLQTDQGDLLKVTINGVPQDSDESDGEGGVVDSIEIKYFDTIPVASSLLIFKSGFLYSNSDAGDQYIYQFEKLGDDPNEKSWISTDYPDEIAAIGETTAITPRNFVNLTLVYIIENLNPLVTSSLYDSGNVSDLPVVFSLCGTGPRSSMRILNHQLQFSEIVTQELPAKVERIFATKLHRDDIYDKLIVLSFYDSTLVLSVGEDVEEAENSGFDTEFETLEVAQIGTDSIVQIHSNGFQQITYNGDDEPESTVKWKPAVGITVVQSACSNTQVILALSTRELVYFEADQFGKLVEYSEHREMNAQISSLSLGQLPGKPLFPFIVAGCKDQTLSVLSTDPSSTLEVVKEEQLSSVAQSLSIFSMEDQSSGAANLFLHIGMANGVYARLRIDAISGELTNPRNQYTGPHEVSVSRLNFDNQNVVGISSVRSYLGYADGADFKITALEKPVFSQICLFKSEDVPENGALGISGNTLTILTVDKLDANMMIESIVLRYTPKDMADCTDDNGMIYVAEADNLISPPFKKEVSYEVDEESQEKYQQFGYKAGDSWGSCIQVISSANKAVGQTIELETGESAFRLCKVSFDDQDYLAVSVAVNQKLMPNRNDVSYIYTYKIETDGSLQFHYKTETDALPLALTAFQGKLLVGMGKVLVMYSMGKKQLLKKCAAKLDCIEIIDLKTQGFRIVASDVRDSVRFITYKPAANKLIVFADDTIARHVTRSLMLDYNTVIVGDKFGQLSVLRCSEDASKTSDEDAHGTVIMGREQRLNGAPYKLNNLMNFYIGDITTSLQRGNLTVGGSECILYTGLQGTIGCLHPLLRLKEINFFRELEKQISKSMESLTDREWIKYRSYYVPIKGCIDGDLMEEYFRLDGEKRLRIAKAMDRLPREIDKQISEMRTRFAY